jgi:hypothetical protein
VPETAEIHEMGTLKPDPDNTGVGMVTVKPYHLPLKAGSFGHHCTRDPV